VRKLDTSCWPRVGDLVGRQSAPMVAPANSASHGPSPDYLGARATAPLGSPQRQAVERLTV